MSLNMKQSKDLFIVLTTRHILKYLVSCLLRTLFIWKGPFQLLVTASVICPRLFPYQLQTLLNVCSQFLDGHCGIDAVILHLSILSNRCYCLWSLIADILQRAMQFWWVLILGISSTEHLCTLKSSTLHNFNVACYYSLQIFVFLF